MNATARAEAYDRHTGRYGPELSAAFVRFAAVEPGMRVLDVGCGTGALTTRLAPIVGGDRVSAVDPSRDYADACRRRVPGAAVHVGSAEALPFDGGSFDAVLAQLVIQALDDAPAAAREMRRVTTRGGVVATCVWDFRGGMPLLDAYWAAARDLDPDGASAGGDDSADPWCTRDGLVELWEQAGIADAQTAELSAGAGYDDFDDAWFSFAAGAGFSGAYCRSLDDRRRAALREQFRRRLAAPDGSFRLDARAWAVRGRA
ncbi:MAG TPA: methyltransferase domain-containing protein [Solirubrobacter sp.]|nr:methyltransferase domain-containing protein [Solirubrobacter sp.]